MNICVSSIIGENDETKLEMETRNNVDPAILLKYSPYTLWHQFHNSFKAILT